MISLSAVNQSTGNLAFYSPFCSIEIIQSPHDLVPASQAVCSGIWPLPHTRHGRVGLLLTVWSTALIMFPGC